MPHPLGRKRRRFLLRCCALIFLASAAILRAAVSVPLPPPTEWQPPAGLPVAPGDPFTASFTGAAPVAQAPVVGEWNRTVRPGESFTLTGAHFTLLSGSQAGADTRVLLWADNAQGGELRTLPTWKVSENLIMASVPGDLAYGVYLVWVENQLGPSSPVILNRAQPEWVGPLGNTAAPGTTKRLFGKNLSTNFGETTSWIYLRPAGSTVAPTAVAVTQVEPLAVWFTVPPGLAAGDYDVFLHNGHGGALGWSAALRLTVAAAWQRGATVVNLTDTGTASRTADLQAAIDSAAAQPNGGTVQLAAGTYRVATDVTVKGNVCLAGAGKGQTIILGQGGTVLLSGTAGNHIAFTDLSFRADTGIALFYVVSKSFSGGSYNQDLLFHNVDFQVSSDTVSKIALSLQAQRFELTGCTMDGILEGACIDWWIHDNVLHGSRNEQDGAIAARSDTSVQHGGMVLENNTALTPAWPTGPSGSRNYKTFLTTAQLNGSVPAGSIWCSRLIYFAVHQASLLYSYIGHNTTQDVAIDDNKGEQILFHSQEALDYAQVASSSGTTLTIRTDGTIDGDPNFRLVLSTTSSIAPLTTVPATVSYGKTDGVAYVILADGTGRGQIRRIVSHTATTITVDSPWRVPPDATTKFFIDYVYLGHLQYKNALAGVPAGWVETKHIASLGIDYDGNSFYNCAIGNNDTRTYYGDGILGHLLAPSYWNEMRDAVSITPFKNGTRISARGGDWGTNPSVVRTLGPLCLGDWVRGGSSDQDVGFDAVIETWGAAPANKLFIEGSGFENVTLGTTITATSYAEGLFRQNHGAAGVTPKLLLEPWAIPILVQNGTAPNHYYNAVFTNNKYSPGTQVGNSGGATLTDGFAQLPLAPVRKVIFDGANVAVPQTITVGNGGIADMAWTAQADQPWLQATPLAGGSVGAEQANGALQISLQTSALPAGLSQGYITLRSGALTTTVEVSVDYSAPAAPSPLTATPGLSVGQINVSWPAVAGAQSYVLQRSGSSGSSGYATLTTVAAPAISYTDADPTLAADHLYYYEIAASNLAGASPFSAAASASPFVPSTFAGWAYRSFGANAQPSQAAMTANPAHDGFSNLLKYALGLDPAISYSGTSPGLPATETVQNGANRYLTLTFHGTATDLLYRVLATSDLTGGWSPVYTSAVGQAPGTVTASDSVPLTSPGQRFLRLEVTAP